MPKVNGKSFPYTPAGKAAAAKAAAGPANPALKGSATGMQKKAAGMAKRTANKPVVAPAGAKKKKAGPTIGSGKKGMYY